MKLFAALFVYFCLDNVLPALSDEPKNCSNILVTKREWGGRLATNIEYGVIPLKYVVIHHTVTPECSSGKTSLETCSSLLKSIQNNHMETLDFYDIGYNFMVGNDGKVYEGAGWHKVGAHTYGYNRKSMGLAFVGTFTDKNPTEKQIAGAKKFLQCAVEKGELYPNYKLLGGKQVIATQSPGLKLYREIQTWPNFAQNP